MYALTDEAYALTAARPGVELTSGRILWLQALCQGYWVAGGLAGAPLGSWLATDLAGLGFTLTALFVVLAMDAVRVERDLPTPVLAFICAVAALALTPGAMLITGMGSFMAALIGRHLLTRVRGATRA